MRGRAYRKLARQVKGWSSRALVTGLLLTVAALAVMAVTPVAMAQQLDWIAPRPGSVTETDLPQIILRMPAGLAAGDLSQWEVFVDGEAWPFVVHAGTQTVTVQLGRPLLRGPHEVLVRAWQAQTQQVHEVSAVFAVLQETPPPGIGGVQAQGKMQLQIGWRNDQLSYDGSASIGLAQRWGEWRVRSQSEWRVLPYGGELAWGTPGLYIHLLGGRLELVGGPDRQQHIELGQFGLGKASSLAYSSTLVAGGLWERGDELALGLGRVRESGEANAYLLMINGRLGNVGWGTYHLIPPGVFGLGAGDRSAGDGGEAGRTHLAEATWTSGSLQIDGAFSQAFRPGSPTPRAGAGLQIRQDGPLGQMAHWGLLARWTSPDFASLNRQIPSGTLFAKLETVVATEPLLSGLLSLTQRVDGTRVISGNVGLQASQGRCTWELTGGVVQVRDGNDGLPTYTLSGESKANYQLTPGLAIGGGYGLARLGPWAGEPLRQERKGYAQLEGPLGAVSWQLQWGRSEQAYPRAALCSQRNEWNLQLAGPLGRGERQRWQLIWGKTDDWAQAGAATPARVVRQSLQACAQGTLGALWTWEGKAKMEQSNLSVRPSWETTASVGYQF